MYISKIENLKDSFNALYKQAQIILANGGTVDADVKKHVKNRTGEQNAYYWLFNRELAEFLDKSGLTYGEFKIPYTKDIIHDINKTLYGVKTTTKLSIGEFQMSELPANYLERKGYCIH